MKVVRFAPQHIRRLSLQPAQHYLRAEILRPGYAEFIAQAGEAFTALDGDDVIACAGVAVQWEGRALAWALVGDIAGRQMLPLTRAIAGFLSQTPHRRIETAVDVDFAPGHRWARMLGFVCEGRMRAYLPTGADCDLYARVRD